MFFSLKKKVNIKNKIFRGWSTCAGFRWLSFNNECDIFAMAKETYTDFQPNIANIYNTIYINKNGQESKSCVK